MKDRQVMKLKIVVMIILSIALLSSCANRMDGFKRKVRHMSDQELISYYKSLQLVTKDDQPITPHQILTPTIETPSTPNESVERNKSLPSNYGYPESKDGLKKKAKMIRIE